MVVLLVVSVVVTSTVFSVPLSLVAGTVVSSVDGASVVITLVVTVSVVVILVGATSVVVRWVVVAPVVEASLIDPLVVVA